MTSELSVFREGCHYITLWCAIEILCLHEQKWGHSYSRRQWTWKLRRQNSLMSRNNCTLG